MFALMMSVMREKIVMAVSLLVVGWTIAITTVANRVPTRNRLIYRHATRFDLVIGEILSKYSRDISEIRFN